MTKAFLRPSNSSSTKKDVPVSRGDLCCFHRTLFNAGPFRDDVSLYVTYFHFQFRREQGTWWLKISCCNCVEQRIGYQMVVRFGSKTPKLCGKDGEKGRNRAATNRASLSGFFGEKDTPRRSTWMVTFAKFWDNVSPLYELNSTASTIPNANQVAYF